MAGQFSIGHAGLRRHRRVHGGDRRVAHRTRRSAARRARRSRTRSSSCRSCSSSARLMAALFGFVVGLPSLRLRGDYLAIVTLGFAEIFRLVIATAQTGGDAKAASSRALSRRSAGRTATRAPTTQGVPLYAGPFWIFGARPRRDPRRLAPQVLRLGARAPRAARGRDRGGRRGRRSDALQGHLVRHRRGRRRHRGRPAGDRCATASATVQPDQFNFAVLVRRDHDGHPRRLGQRDRRDRRRRLRHVHGEDDRAAPGRSRACRRCSARHPWLDLNALRMVIYATVLIALMILRPEGLFGERELFRRAAPKPAPERPAAEPEAAREGATRRPSAEGGRVSALELARRHQDLRRPARRRRRQLHGPEERSSSGSSARTAPARRRSSTSSPASTSPTRARSASAARDLAAAEARADRAPSASRARSRTSASSASSRCSRTCSSRARTAASARTSRSALLRSPRLLRATRQTMHERALELLAIFDLDRHGRRDARPRSRTATSGGSRSRAR